MRCSQCNKFVSMELTEEPELSLTVDQEGYVSGDARIERTCAECGTTLKSATFAVEVDLSAEVTEHRDSCTAGKDALLELTHEEGGAFEEAGLDRHGRPISNPRYRKTLFGVEVNVAVQCACGEEFRGSYRETMQASAMDEEG